MASELWRGVHAFIIILALLVTSAMMFGKMILTTSGCRWKSNVWLCWPQIRDLKYEMPLQLDLRWSLSVTHFDPQSLSTSSCFKTLQYIHIRKFSLWIAAIYLEKKTEIVYVNFTRAHRSSASRYSQAMGQHPPQCLQAGWRRADLFELAEYVLYFEVTSRKHLEKKNFLHNLSTRTHPRA